MSILRKCLNSGLVSLCVLPALIIGLSWDKNRGTDRITDGLAGVSKKTMRRWRRRCRGSETRRMLADRPVNHSRARLPISSLIISYNLVTISPGRWRILLPLSSRLPSSMCARSLNYSVIYILVLHPPFIFHLVQYLALSISWAQRNYYKTRNCADHVPPSYYLSMFIIITI